MQGPPTDESSSEAANMTAPERYWNTAGERGYDEVMYASGAVAAHIHRRLWSTAIEIADRLGVPRDGYVLDYGCGDGAFANQALAAHYARIDGLDLAPAAIDRANAMATSDGMHFAVADLTAMDYGSLPRYDAVFMIGILHHIKQATPAVLAKIAGITDRVIVLEPNGDNLVRKALELTPSYRRAGEDSFGTRELVRIFERAGFASKHWQRINLFPNFTPEFIYRAFEPLESRVEASRVLRALCTVNMFGFTTVTSASG